MAGDAGVGVGDGGGMVCTSEGCNFVSVDMPMSYVSSGGSDSVSYYSSNSGTDLPSMSMGTETTIASVPVIQLEGNGAARTMAMEGQTPTVTVSSDIPHEEAHVIVGADGTIMANGQLLRNQAMYNIRVEPGASQESVAKAVTMVNNLNDGRVTVSAQPGLMSSEELQKYQPASAPGESIPGENTPGGETPDPEMSPGGGSDDSDSPCPGGTCPGNPGSPREDDYEPPAEEPLPSTDDTMPEQQTEQLPVAFTTQRAEEALRFSMRKDLEYARPTANALGAYQMPYYGWVHSFFDADIVAALGNPPDMTKLHKALQNKDLKAKFDKTVKARTDAMRKHGMGEGADKLDKFFQKLATDEKFAKEFGDFANKQREASDLAKTNQPIPQTLNATDAEMRQFFDQHMQEAAVQSQIASAADAQGIQNLQTITSDQAAQIGVAVTGNPSDSVAISNAFAQSFAPASAPVSTTAER